MEQLLHRLLLWIKKCLLSESRTFWLHVFDRCIQTNRLNKYFNLIGNPFQQTPAMIIPNCRSQTQQLEGLKQIVAVLPSKSANRDTNHRQNIYTGVFYMLDAYTSIREHWPHSHEKIVKYSSIYTHSSVLDFKYKTWNLTKSKVWIPKY